MQSEITFEKPKNFGKACQIMWENNASFAEPEADPFEAVEDYMAAINDSPSNFVTVYFEDEYDPITPVYRLARLLEGEGSKYVGIVPEFVERSRGIRSKEQFIVGTGNSNVEQERYFVEWGDELQMTESCMRKAGMSPEIIQAVFDIMNIEQSVSPKI